MVFRIFALIAALATLTACGGRGKQLAIRNSPQTQHFLNGGAAGSAQNECTDATAYLCDYQEVGTILGS